MSDLKISNLCKSFPGMDRPAVNNVSLDIKTGGLIAFLGPSGCGKTTILKMITGLFQPDSGDITLDNASLLPIATENRGVVMVFQNYLLFPYMNVNENVGFALKMKGMDKGEIDKKVKDTVEAKVRLEEELVNLNKILEKLSNDNKRLRVENDFYAKEIKDALNDLEQIIKDLGI